MEIPELHSEHREGIVTDRRVSGTRDGGIEIVEVRVRYPNGKVSDWMPVAQPSN
jgi:hypothetical protein